MTQFEYLQLLRETDLLLVASPFEILQELKTTKLWPFDPDPIFQFSINVVSKDTKIHYMSTRKGNSTESATFMAPLTSFSVMQL